MTRKILFLLFLLPLGSLFAQSDCDGELIDFESSNNYILIDDNSDLWGIGVPTKDAFIPTYSGEKAIMTSLANSYGTNVSTYFQIKAVNKGGNNTTLTFSHKWNTDTLSDYGFLTYSLDNGKSWNLLDDTTFSYNFCNPVAEIWHSRWNDPPGTGINDVPAKFSGEKQIWVYEEYKFIWWNAVKKSGLSEDPCSPMDITVRFNFISDDIDNSKEGWIIDNIRFEWDFAGDVEELLAEKIKIWPNPFNESISIDNQDYSSVEIADISGRVIESHPINTYCESTIPADALYPGIYIIRLKKEGGMQTTLMVKE